MKNVLDMFRLDGRVAFVTGGARNLGRDMATALAQAGADVVVTSRHSEAAVATAAQIASETGRQTLGLGLDVRQESEVIAAVDAALARFGRIDILVNNAGNVVSTPENKPLEVRPTQEWDETISVNLRGAFLCSKRAASSL
jgi:NAD(P)-dependent dehydrogenase (short-subunit alcohol dehydrogenase family)